MFRFRLCMHVRGDCCFIDVVCRVVPAKVVGATFTDASLFLLNFVNKFSENLSRCKEWCPWCQHCYTVS